MSTAAALIIGNEILSGKVQDTNGPYLIRRLRELGVDLRRILVIPDEVDVIAATVAELRKKTHWVFCSGGIGPTHDDVTVRGVAQGLGLRVVRDPEIEGKIRQHYGERVTPETFRLADMPEGAHLVESPGIWVPILEVEGFYLLPGVPQLFRLQFDAMAERFRGPPFFLRCIYVSEGEPAIAAILDRHSAAHTEVLVGSYPRFDEADHRVKLTIEGRVEKEVERAFSDLLSQLPPNSVVRTS
jgi:molybdenum cofactor synthesis domain-containing protein